MPLPDTQDTWAQLLGGRYQHTQVVLFRDGIESACGLAQSATGPFYCPTDHKVYLDLGFFNELSRRFGAPGDFAGHT
jgi:predicted metalloprotease